LAGKCTAKTGAAFYANTGGNSMAIGRGFCGGVQLATTGRPLINVVGLFRILLRINYYCY
jgi:hypothetical protein